MKKKHEQVGWAIKNKGRKPEFEKDVITGFLIFPSEADATGELQRWNDEDARHHEIVKVKIVEV